MKIHTLSRNIWPIIFFTCVKSPYLSRSKVCKLHYIILCYTMLCYVMLWLLWLIWLRRQTNDQKIICSNPSWIYHSGGIKEVHFPLPLHTKDFFFKWYSEGSNGIVSWSVLCDNEQLGCMLLGELRWNQEWRGPIAGVICAVDIAVSLDVDYNPSPLPLRYVIYVWQF